MKSKSFWKLCWESYCSVTTLHLLSRLIFFDELLIKKAYLVWFQIAEIPAVILIVLFFTSDFFKKTFVKNNNAQ